MEVLSVIKGVISIGDVMCTGCVHGGVCGYREEYSSKLQTHGCEYFKSTLQQEIMSKGLLKYMLNIIEGIDPSNSANAETSDAETASRYELRNEVVIQAVTMAIRSGYKAGFMVHDPIEDLVPNDELGFMTPSKWDPRWGVVAVINLPTGQVSWHLDSTGIEYDGHDNSSKWKRIEAFRNEVR